MFKKLTLTGILLGSLAVTSPAMARENCGVRETVVAKLQDSYSETLVAGGLQGNKSVQTMVEVWASQKTGTFTMLLTSPEGVSCVVAVGTNFFTQPLEEIAEGRNG
ncbi:hypothetical protein [Cognatishimia sp.]|uniref:hypothetical protein n=1 Tax=Cognatishimia sp. TaxID=2211648 RepID=UPI003512E2C1